MQFKKIEKQSVADRAFDILKHEIAQGDMKVGDKLPSESSIAQQLGVSKASVRVAIQRLVTLGLVETIAGSGSFIKDFKADDFLEQMSEFLLTEKDIHQITEYRLATEMANTEVAMKNATEEDFQKLEEIMGKMYQAYLENDVASHSKYDHLFHLQICKSTHNKVFVQSYEIIGKLLRQHTAVLNKAYLQKNPSVKKEEDTHWRLIEAIRRKDVAAARACYVEMFSVYEGME